MKTTNYEISKKLKEIGFRTRSDFYYTYAYTTEDDRDVFFVDYCRSEPIGKCYPAYDLETILDALPDEKYDKEVASFSEVLELSKDYICYDSELPKDRKFIIWREEKESLADTAARLLIKLVEKGMVNLKNDK